MYTKTSYAVCVNGQKAVDAARRFCKGFCYRQIMTHDRTVGQMEVVIDEPGSRLGLSNKWVAVSWIKSGSDINEVLSCLHRLGFSGCLCEIIMEEERGSTVYQRTICYTRV